MRIAAIADIHGNVLALDAVLDDLAARRIDLVVNLGDLVSGPLWPRETFERLARLGAPAVRGNHDRWVATRDPAKMGASDRFAFDAMAPEQRRALGALPFQLEVAPGIVAFHATPSGDDTYLLDGIENGRVVRDRHQPMLRGSETLVRG